jgi:hypothetical protein
MTLDAPDDDEVRRGPWLELVTDEPVELEKKIREAGLPQVDYLDNAYYYFRAPGDQVMRVVGCRRLLISPRSCSYPTHHTEPNTAPTRLQLVMSRC